MKIKIFAIREDEKEAFAAYEKNHPGLELSYTEDQFNESTVDQAAGCDGICILQVAPVSKEAEFYQKLASMGIKQITTRTAGYDMIDVAKANAAGLIVTNVPAYSPRSVSEFSLMQIFRLLRHSAEFEVNTAKQDFRWLPELQSREIHTVTIGIIGAGRIGGSLAEMLRNLGARVLAYDIKPRVEITYTAQYVSLDELLAQSDVISLHVDLNPTTVNLINDEVFSKMKKGVLIVNAARGPVIDSEALFRAIDKGIVAGAALDALPDEGPYFNYDCSGQEIKNPVLAEAIKRPEVLVTPHIAFYTSTAIENMVQISLDDIISIVENGTTDHAV